jgi:hypothetical protein
MLLEVGFDRVHAFHRPKVSLQTVPSILTASWERAFFLNATPKRAFQAFAILDDAVIYFYNKVVLVVLRAVDKAHDEERG